MAEISGNERAWSDQARALAAEDAEIDPVDRLARLLAHIEAGCRLRRPLDRQIMDDEGERVRRLIVRGVAELRQAVDDLLDACLPDTAAQRMVAAKLKEWLGLERLALQSITAAAQRGPLSQAMALEAMRGDVEWFGLLAARLDRERAAGRAAWIEVELARIRKSLIQEAGRGADDRAGKRLIARCERMYGVLIERRVQKELSGTVQNAPPERLEAIRLQLSRLQARIDSSQPIGDGEAAGAGIELEPWSEALRVRRVELAGLAESELLNAEPAAARRSSDLIVQAVHDDLSETITFLEDMPVDRAARRLELALEDLDRLIATFRKLKDSIDRLQQRRSKFDAAQTMSRESDDLDECRRRVDRNILKTRRLRRRVRSEWQDKALAMRLQNLLGRRGVKILENVILSLIFVLTGLIISETLLDRAGRLSEADRAWFAWVDLAVCSILLAEFALKMTFAPRKALYFQRHFLIDFLASLPFGFLSHQLDAMQIERHVSRAAETLRVLRSIRLVQSIRYLRVMMPVVRLARIGLFVLRLSDRLVRKNAGLLNRNIVLFEPYHEQHPESSGRHRIATFRNELENAEALVLSWLDRGQADLLAARALSDLEIRLELLPSQAVDDLNEERIGREIPVEALVERLIQLTPEALLDRMGQGFVISADRYLRLLDAPLVRRLPLVRSLVAYREKSPAEAVTLAANYVGDVIQRVLDIIYFLADLQGTLSPAIFLDRVGQAIVNAVRTPAKRLLILGSVFLTLFLVVNLVSVLRPFRRSVDELQNLLGWPVIVLGGVCLAFWILGTWFRKIANQSADFCERVVEAQFAAQTKNFKSSRRDQDGRILAQRVIDPELLLRASDDQAPEVDGAAGPRAGASKTGARMFFENRELHFLRNIRWLYQDYLDGSPFHRSDTKASVQLLGNLALSNLRRSHLGHLLREGRELGRLDLNRSGGLLGGPYLWFNYITRIIIQETAVLLLDYNRNAIPLDRLSCSSESERRAYQKWLAKRLRIDPDEVSLPDLIVAESEENGGRRTRPEAARRPEAAGFFETVEFTAIDFLSDDPERDAEIQSRFGDQVAQLVAHDRQQNVRKAFRSFPLHELPLAQRTINPYVFYDRYLSHGRIVFFPLVVAGGLLKSAIMAVRGVYKGVLEVLDPRVTQDREVPADTYWAALRKIHRMRKPAFMGSLRLRARFDVEYLGLPLPSAPETIAADSLMEKDLDFIGASRQDRIIAEQTRRGHLRRLEWIHRWLVRFDWSFDRLPAYLAREIPYLANRGGEALRALVAAWVLDHDDVASLSFSIEALTMLMEYAAAPEANLQTLPPGLPDPVLNLRRLWRPVHRVSRPWPELFNLPCFPSYDPAARKRIATLLRRHRRAVGGWARVVLGQGGEDPWNEVRARMHDVLLKTDLWSDQILVLRAVQTLTMLDVQHNSELVWTLGGYSRREDDAPSPLSATTEDDEAPPAPGDDRPGDWWTQSVESQSSRGA
ncbi:MAG: hypothetical protein P4L85_14445 [Paludisphaera borealis]|uniref:ion transporter n=1 Tax=Paludisphaera borealis TaxID=1387353 RepID=UPI002846E5CC|nr:ion transporter [Paludisphaera borealis]MDR3620547.1 hypothetical protein [Paludisphaera borealis]